MNPKVDLFLSKAHKWRDEFELMRSIALECDLIEEVKWGTPCYTHNGNNVVLIHGFKEYCAFLFFKGALLSDSDNILIIQSENVQASRQVRFTNVQEIIALKATLKAYINEAVEVEKAGLKVEFKTTKEFAITEEFQIKLNQMPLLKSAFEALTPGRQRAYLLHFSQPKQSKTREARIEKFIPKILNGKGIDD